MLHEQETYLDNTASWAWQQLSIGKLATVDCWAEVYVENLAGVPVWFDDLEIQAGALPVAVVVQETHYDPWGLELAGIGYNASGNPEHDFKFQGKELVGDFGLGWYDFLWRQYDPVLGRFNSVDPMAHLMRRVSPYAFVFNNPLRFVDPDGMVPDCPNGDCPDRPVPTDAQITTNNNLRKEVHQTVNKLLKKLDVSGGDADLKGIDTDGVSEQSLNGGYAAQKGKVLDELGVDDDISISISHEIKEGKLELAETIVTSDKTTQNRGNETKNESSSSVGGDAGGDKGKGSYSGSEGRSQTSTTSLSQERGSEKTKTYVYNATIVTTVSVTITPRGGLDKLTGPGQVTMSYSFEARGSFRTKHDLQKGANNK